MCGELSGELDEGKRLAAALATHLLSMGAAKAVIPVFFNDEKYEVTITHLPVKPEDEKP